MGKYKIVYGTLGSGPLCQIQDSHEDFFLDKLRGTLPVVLQHYYEYLKTTYVQCPIECIVSLEEEEENHLNIKLFGDASITKGDMSTFFDHWYCFIKSEKSNNNNAISVVIEGNDLLLEAYKDRIEAKHRKLDTKKKKIDTQVNQDMRSTVLKWTGGVSTALGAVGFAVGGPIGGLCAAGLGLALGPFVGLHATSESELSAQTKQNIKNYASKKFLPEPLTVMPLRERVTEGEEKLDKPPIEADRTQEYTPARVQSFSKN